MLRYGFFTACAVPLPLRGSVAPAEDLRAPEVLLQPKTYEPRDGNISTVGAKCFRSEEIGLCVMKFYEAGAALVQDLGAEFATQPLYAAIITPVIHYCMDGLEICKIQQCWVRIPSPFLPFAQLERLQEGRQFSAGLRGVWSCCGSGMCAVHVGRQSEGNLSRGACWWRQG